LREESAKLLGYPTFAAYRLEDSMAKTPEAVRGLLERVWQPARGRALRDRDDLQALIAEEGGNFALAPWDWRYYAEKLRKLRCDIDEATIKPYLQLEQIIAGAFYTAKRLFGLSFEPCADVPVWHPEVRVWEVRDAAGCHRGLFFGDYFARPSKKSKSASADAATTPKTPNAFWKTKSHKRTRVAATFIMSRWDRSWRSCLGIFRSGRCFDLPRPL